MRPQSLNRLGSGTGEIHNSQGKKRFRTNPKLSEIGQVSSSQAKEQYYKRGRRLYSSPSLPSQPIPATAQKRGSGVNRGVKKEAEKYSCGNKKQDPESRESLGGCGPAEPRQQVHRGRICLPRSPLAVRTPYPTWRCTSKSQIEALHNLHQGVKLHTTAVQWPTALAHCVNLRVIFWRRQKVWAVRLRGPWDLFRAQEA